MGVLNYASQSSYQGFYTGESTYEARLIEVLRRCQQVIRIIPIKLSAERLFGSCPGGLAGVVDGGPSLLNCEQLLVR